MIMIKHIFNYHIFPRNHLWKSKDFKCWWKKFSAHWMIQIQFSWRIFVHYCQNKSHKLNLHVNSCNTIGKQGAPICNCLAENVKSTDLICELKYFLKGWYGCKCYLGIGYLCHLCDHVLFLIHIKNC